MVLYGSFFAVVLLLVGLIVVLPAGAAAASKPQQQRQQPPQQHAGLFPAFPGGMGPRSDSSSEQRPEEPQAAGGGGAKHMPLAADALTSAYCSWNQLYLPQIVAPDHYDLEITSDPRQAPYSVDGTIKIHLEPLQNVTPCIVLHSKGITISSVRLVVGDEAAGDFIAGGYRLGMCVLLGWRGDWLQVAFLNSLSTKSPVSRFTPFQPSLLSRIDISLHSFSSPWFLPWPPAVQTTRPFGR